MKFLKITDNKDLKITNRGKDLKIAEKIKEKGWHKEDFIDIPFIYIPVDGVIISIECKPVLFGNSYIVIRKTAPNLETVSFRFSVFNKGFSMKKVISKDSTQIQTSHKGLSMEKWNSLLQPEAQKIFDDFIESDKKLLHFDKELQDVMDKKLKKSP